ncbi:hypothetical protein P1J78_22130 [Psychromarinibacter sp. C21-152]|uniref:Uncharacterized protein n=1 Tax=Psychromarinibacter sediminicola TaxID=3033385 RepID=A0AAE3NXF9_9RHOB|nr:hypothetical protein [Psychromarinibacter sediminicola]MDF0603434.1 hypothetical protein [Psychromarinibacter sediminicola]
MKRLIEVPEAIEIRRLNSGFDPGREGAHVAPRTVPAVQRSTAPAWAEGRAVFFLRYALALRQGTSNEEMVSSVGLREVIQAESRREFDGILRLSMTSPLELEQEQRLPERIGLSGTTSCDGTRLRV